jgi:hypothetical protein
MPDSRQYGISVACMPGLWHSVKARLSVMWQSIVACMPGLWQSVVACMPGMWQCITGADGGSGGREGGGEEALKAYKA